VQSSGYVGPFPYSHRETMGLKGGGSSLGSEGRSCRGSDEISGDIIWVGNFRFIPQIFGEVILLPMSKITSPNGSCAQAAVGIAVTDSCHLLVCFISMRALDGLLQPVLLILHPHRVAVPFPPTFASPWRNRFVQIHEISFVHAKLGINLQKWPKNDQNWGMGLSYGPGSHRFPTVEFQDIGTGR